MTGSATHSEVPQRPIIQFEKKEETIHWTPDSRFQKMISTADMIGRISMQL
jgi:hypothetical protein